MKAFVGMGAALAVASGMLGACSGSRVEGRVADRVVTAVTPATVAAGETASVSCTILNERGETVEGETTWRVEPDAGWTAKDEALSPTVAGTYQVHCASPYFALEDATGATLTVTAGAPVKVTTVLDKPTVQVFEATGVTCAVEDAWGNPVEAATTVSGPDALLVSGHTVKSEVIGSYEVACSVTGAEVEVVPATLEVTAGDPAEVELLAKPAKLGYSVLDQVTLYWVVRDVYGNEITGLPGTLTVPSAGMTVVDAATNKYQFTDEGVFVTQVQLDPPYELLHDSLTLVVDESGPVINLKWPERGVTIQGDGSPVELVGTVTDAFSDVAKFELNGEVITLGADGTFKVPMLPVWGLNVIVAVAEDSRGNRTKLTPTYHYSKSYISFVDQSAQGVKQDDGVQLLLGQKFLDDGVHDHSHINDLATLLEVLLGDLDITQLTQGIALDQTIPIINQTIDLFVVQATLKGHIKLSAALVQPTGIGPTTVAIDSRTGGIDSSIAFGDGTANGLDLTLQVQAALVGELGWSSIFGSNKVDASATATLETGADAEEISILTKIDIHMPPGGTLAVDLKTFDLDLVGFEIHPIKDIELLVTADLSAFSWLGLGKYTFPVDLSALVSLSDLAKGLLDPLTQQLLPLLTDLLQPIIETFADDLLESLLLMLAFDTQFELPQLLGPKPEPILLDIYTDLTSVVFTDDGGTLGMSLGAYAEKGVERDPHGAIQRDGCLLGLSDTFEYDWSRSVGIAGKTDAINAAVFAVWWSSFLDGPLDLGALTGGGGGGLPIDGLQLELSWLLPPVVNDCSDANAIEAQIGDLYAEIDGNILGFPIQATVFLDAALSISFLSDAGGLSVSVDELVYLDVEVLSLTEIDFIDLRDLLENSLGDLLGGFIVGQTFGPIELPEIDLGALVPGLPQGAVLKLGALDISKQEGYLVVGGDLE